MNNKSYTFLISSNRRGTTRRLTIWASWLKAGMVLLIVATVILSAMIVDYAGLLVQSTENKRLRAENARLNTQFRVVEEKLNALESGLERVKTFSSKLRLITETNGSRDQDLRLAMGPLVRSNQAIEQLHEPIGEREVAGLDAATDDVFFEDAPLNFSKGELSVMGQRDYASLSIRIDQSLKDISLQEQGIMNLWGNLREKQSLLAGTPSVKPVAGWFTSRFGYREDPYTNRPTMHGGLDIAAAPGSPVHAPADGIVSFAGYDAGYGKLVSIDHGYGVVTRYGHNSRIFVTVGQKVSRYDVIAAVGNTGRSTGPHLHYEVRVNNIPVDPANYILH